MDVQRYARIFDKLLVDPRTGILVTKKYENENEELDKYRVLLPKSQENKVLAHYHTNPMAGHLGIGATAKRMLVKYYHPRPQALVTRFVAHCLECQRKRQHPRSKLKTHRNVMLTNQASYPMGALFVDFYGPLPQTEEGYRYILSAKDGFRKYCWLKPTKNMGAQTVAEKL